MTQNFIPPAGFEQIEIQSSYSRGLGTLYYRKDPVALGFFSTPQHCNRNDVIHGGAMATLADIGLFLIGRGDDENMNGATLSLHLNYLRPGPIGQFIHCDGRIVRKGGSIIFVEGSLWADTTELMTFDGTIKIFKPRA
ncbi:MAG: PaaI family thioesterase [bacterium]